MTGERKTPAMANKYFINLLSFNCSAQIDDPVLLTYLSNLSFHGNGI